MNKVVFLDRDGVINKDNGDYTFLITDFFILDGVYEALKEFINKGYLLIVITNQGGIAKGLYGHEEVRLLHEFMTQELAKNQIVIQEIYYCPHHPDISNCLCRKPGSLLLEKAIARFQIDAEKSYFIGDRDRDMEAGGRAGVQLVKMETNGSILEAAKQVK